MLFADWRVFQQVPFAILDSPIEMFRAPISAL
jgi:hypothetical protein